MLFRLLFSCHPKNIENYRKLQPVCILPFGHAFFCEIGLVPFGSPTGRVGWSDMPFNG